MVSIFLACWYSDKLGLLLILIKKFLALLWVWKYPLYWFAQLACFYLFRTNHTPLHPPSQPPTLSPTQSLTPALILSALPPSLLPCLPHSFNTYLLSLRASYVLDIALGTRYIQWAKQKFLPSWRAHANARKLFPTIGHSFVKLP